MPELRSPVSIARADAPAPAVIQIEPARDAAAWDRYVGAHPLGTAYHRWAWRELVESVFGHECRYRVARDELGRIRGVLPMVRLRSRLFGDYAVSLPYTNHGGALADDGATRTALMQAAADDGEALGLSYVAFRDREPAPGPWHVQGHKVLMWRELPTDPDQLWSRLGGKLRAQVRRPEREPVSVVVGREDLLAAFYRVFARNMRDLGTPVYDRRLFREVLERFDDAFIVAVMYRGRPAAAGLLLPSADRLEIPWASSLREHNGIGVNMLLYWRCLAEAIGRGYRVFDFGRSTVGSGTWRFKRQWGAEPVQCHWHHWLRDGVEPPNLSPDNPRFRLAIAAWQRLPVAVANLVGPSIVRNLP